MKILVVDDSEMMRKKLQLCIESAGFEIAGEAEDGDEGFEKYKELRPDLVTLDIIMPKVDGLTCLRNIKAYDNNAKIIMCSSMGQKTVTREALQSGALNFFIKPIDEERLIQQFKNLAEFSES